MTGGCGGGTKGRSSHSLLLALSLSYHQLTVPGRQPAIWAGDTMPTHSLALKDVPSDYTGYNKHRFHLTVATVGLAWKVIGFRGNSKSNNLTLAGLKWCASRNVMASDGTKNWRRIRKSQMNTSGHLSCIPCQKTKEKKRKRHDSPWYF